MPARPGATGGYIIAYAVTLASFIVIWFSHPILLYIGRDANLSLWLSKAYADWAYPLDVTAMNPLQGMTSMLMPINPYFNPGTWIQRTSTREKHEPWWPSNSIRGVWIPIPIWRSLSEPPLRSRLRF